MANKEKDEKLDTKCFSYRVEMIVQVLAEDESNAKKKLDEQGGYVSKRIVTLVDAVTLANE